MTVGERPARGFFRRRIARDDASNDVASNDVLAYLDQATFELMRATGRSQLIQSVWVYEHPVDIEGLKRFHRNFAQSLLGNRLVERSPLPFGRARWVQRDGPPAPIRFEEHARPREELMEWADELARLPIDVERGPAWLLAVQPLTNGGTAVSLIGSHVLGDGFGALRSIFEAVTGQVIGVNYSKSGSRTSTNAAVSDLRQAARDVPDTGRTLVKAARLLFEKRHEFIKPKPAQPELKVGGDQIVHVPTVAAFVDTNEWNARAAALGGNSFSLVAGFAAKLGERMGRVSKSGTVSLIIAINQRESLDDTRAQALTLAQVPLDPTNVTTDLAQSRAAVREAREKAKNESDPVLELVGLIPWLPQSGLKGVDLLFGYSENPPVACSSMGDLPPQLAQVDGTDAEYVFVRGIDANVTERELQRSSGHLVVVSGWINGKVTMAIEGYEIGAENSAARLRKLVTQTLQEFGLTGTVE